MDKKALVIVESPTKAKTIRRFLPKNFTVEASVGHIRDLPQTAAEIPAKYKTQEWSRLGIDVEHDFEPLYVIPKDKTGVVRSLKALVKEADEVYLATDEDREGESISWHLLDVLEPKIPVKRMVFHEITQRAISAALTTTRDIDMNLVNAQETRRLLDRLYGYTLSPLIWKKIAYGLSAGRVQSPGLRLIVQRELARCRFVPAEYWDLKVLLEKPGAPGKREFEAKLAEVSGRKIAAGSDFDPETGELKPRSGAVLLQQAEARALEAALAKGTWTVADLTEKESLQRPAPPFITSTLQQEANRKLGMSTRDTMRTAQKLYEEGFITYMRTDSPSLSQEALQGAREAIHRLYGAEFAAESPRQYAAKSKGAQESHEAIRPAGSHFPTPDETGLSGRDKALYELIWKRTLASQMAEARKSTVNARISVGDCVFTASGVKILFPGFIRVYVEGSDDPEGAIDTMDVFLPDLKKGENLAMKNLDAQSHQTKAPVRFTEASLVQRLEKEGIGRPSTYATIITTLVERGYVFKKDNTLVPTYTGMAVTGLLEKNFQSLVNYEFTSDMEKDLDRIAEGQGNQLDYLKKFYLGPQGLKETVDSREKAIDGDESRTIILPQLGPDAPIKIGRFGPYIVRMKPDGEKANASLPENSAPADLRADELETLLRQVAEGPRSLGQHPDSGKNIYALTGRFGPHLQLGEKVDGGEKPRTVSLPKGVGVDDVTLEQALKLLSLPRKLGVNPANGEEITANNGRFGPFVACAGEFRSLKKDDDLYTITLERALELFAEVKVSKLAANTIKEFPVGGGLKRKVTVLAGKFGAYLKVGIRNVSLPEAKKSPEAAAALTLEEVIALVQKPAAEKAAPAKKVAAKKAPAKKAAAKKSASKKTAPKAE